MFQQIAIKYAPFFAGSQSALQVHPNTSMDILRLHTGYNAPQGTALGVKLILAVVHLIVDPFPHFL